MAPTPTTTPDVAAKPAPTAAPTASPTLWAGRYELGERLGSGGLATVYRGRLVGPLGFTRNVAIKRLHPHFSKRSDAVMFLDEARIASCIAHPNVVATLDVVQEGGEYAVVMELIDGTTLEALLSLGAPPLPITLRIVCDMLRGLHAAHEAKDGNGEALHVVHRDVAPSNVLVGRDGLARIGDFGVAKARGRMANTRNGEVKGHLSYMAPEQLVGDEVDARADTFGTGVVLWEALTGRRLFYAESEAQTVYALLERPIVKPSAVTDVPAAVDAVVLRALAREREARFESANAMADALEASSALASRGDVAAWCTEVLARVSAAGSSGDREDAQGVAADTWLDAPPSMVFSSPAAANGGQGVAPAASRVRARAPVAAAVVAMAVVGLLLSTRGATGERGAATSVEASRALLAPAPSTPAPMAEAAVAAQASSPAPSVPVVASPVSVPAPPPRAASEARGPAKARPRPRAPTPVRLYERD